MMRVLFLVILFISQTAISQTKTLAQRYFEDDTLLDLQVDEIFNQMEPSERMAQLLMPAVGRLGMPEESIKQLLRENKIGGVLLLNGTKEDFARWTKEFNELNPRKDQLPYLYSADAEPSLINRKMLGSKVVKKAFEVLSEAEAKEVAKVISEELAAVGVNYNFAPVVDVAGNKTVGYRGFGKNPNDLIPFSKAFIRETQSADIIATAKHFPGHGLVSGDTHKALQVINGELKELQNYPPLIKDSALSIMIAHIAIQQNSKYDTKGLPSTCSRVIVTDLLRDELGFKGLIVTDAMNMGGVLQVKDAALKAVEAGCDIVLMPPNPSSTHNILLTRYLENESFRKGADESVKRIIRMKLCLTQNK